MIESKFNFLPLVKKRKVPTEIYVRIGNASTLVIGKYALLNLGVDIDKGSFIHLYADPEKRALAFKFDSKIDGATIKKGGNIRIVKINKAGVAVLSIAGFLKALPDIEYGKIEVKFYQDTWHGKLWYIVIPRKKKEDLVMNS